MSKLIRTKQPEKIPEKVPLNLNGRQTFAPSWSTRIVGEDVWKSLVEALQIRLSGQVLKRLASSWPRYNLTKDV